MSHVTHLAKNKATLELRSQIIRLIREYFWSHEFLEVETPLILRLPGQEPYLTPMPIAIHNERGEEFKGYLHTSPEYTMKKMLAGGFEKIFSICKCFRDHESFGGAHNPEFTMIEWYRTSEDMFVLMQDVEELIAYVVKKLEKLKIENWKLFENYKLKIGNFRRVHMRDLWEECMGINLDDYLNREKMFELCVQKKYNATTDESYEDLFFRIFLNEIEPKLADMGTVIVHHYPAQMAALSRLSPDDPRYAERFEVYVNGVELANAFSELTDADEQLRRLQEEQTLRRSMGKDVYDIDTEFVEALKTMPSSAGIALGVDRLVQVFATLQQGSGQGCKNIDNVLSLPASKLFG